MKKIGAFLLATIFFSTAAFACGDAGVATGSDGSVSAPAYSYTLDSGTGFWRSGTGAVSFSSSGVAPVVFNSAGITSAAVTVNDLAYDASTWDNNLKVPSMNAVRDKIESLAIVSHFTNTGGVIRPTTSTDNLSLGTSSNIGKLGVAGDTDEVQGEFDAYSTQTSPIIRAKDHTGAAILALADDGTLSLSGTGTPGATFYGSTSGTTFVKATAIAGTTTLTLPAATDTLVGKATTDTLTNKTISGNVAANFSNGGTVTVPSGTDTLVARTSTDTLTNKRITIRKGTTTSSATPTINTDNVNYYSLTAQTADITSFTTNLSGTPNDGDTLWISITGTAARAITWGASFESSTVTLPTTTVSTARLDTLFAWNTATSKWRCLASA